MWQVAVIFLSPLLSDLTTCKVNAWLQKIGYLREARGVKKVCKNDRVGVWWENLRLHIKI